MVLLSGRYSCRRETKKWCWGNIELWATNPTFYLLRLALEALQNDVEHPVGVEVEVTNEGLDDLGNVGGSHLE